MSDLTNKPYQSKPRAHAKGTPVYRPKVSTNERKGFKSSVSLPETPIDKSPSSSSPPSPRKGFKPGTPPLFEENKVEYKAPKASRSQKRKTNKTSFTNAAIISMASQAAGNRDAAVEKLREVREETSIASSPAVLPVDVKPKKEMKKETARTETFYDLTSSVPPQLQSRFSVLEQELVLPDDSALRRIIARSDVFNFVFNLDPKLGIPHSCVNFPYFSEGAFDPQLNKLYSRAANQICNQYLNGQITASALLGTILSYQGTKGQDYLNHMTVTRQILNCLLACQSMELRLEGARDEWKSVPLFENNFMRVVDSFVDVYVEQIYWQQSDGFVISYRSHTSGRLINTPVPKMWDDLNEGLEDDNRQNDDRSELSEEDSEDPSFSSHQENENSILNELINEEQRIHEVPGPIPSSGKGHSIVNGVIEKPVRRQRGLVPNAAARGNDQPHEQSNDGGAVFPVGEEGSDAHGSDEEGISDAEHFAGLEKEITFNIKVKENFKNISTILAPVSSMFMSLSSLAFINWSSYSYVKRNAHKAASLGLAPSLTLKMLPYATLVSNVFSIGALVIAGASLLLNVINAYTTYFEVKPQRIYRPHKTDERHESMSQKEITRPSLLAEVTWRTHKRMEWTTGYRVVDRFINWLNWQRSEKPTTALVDVEVLRELSSPKFLNHNLSFKDICTRMRNAVPTFQHISYDRRRLDDSVTLNTLHLAERLAAAWKIRDVERSVSPIFDLVPGDFISRPVTRD